MPRLRSFFQALTALVSLLTLTPSSSVFAATPADAHAILYGTQFYDTATYATGTACSSASGSSTVPAGTLPSMIPEPYNGAFTAAGAKFNVSPALIAGLFTEEHFTNQPTTSIAGDWARLPSVQKDPNSGWATSPDKAAGPFQFIPSTWASLGQDGNGDGVKDVENLLDASFGAANYAAHDGATADKPQSAWYAFADGYSGHTKGYADHFMSYVNLYLTGSTTTATDAAASTLVAPSSTSPCTTTTGGGTVTGPTGAGVTVLPAGAYGVNTYYYNQADKQWQVSISGPGVPGGYNVRECACGPSSIAMIAATLKNDPSITPVTAVKSLGANGGIDSGCGAYDSGLVATLGATYGLKVTTVDGSRYTGLTDSSLNTIRADLKAHQIILVHTSKWIGFTSKAATTGHFLIIIGADDAGNFYVNNPGARADVNKPIPAAGIEQWLDEAWAVSAS